MGPHETALKGKGDEEVLQDFKDRTIQAFCLTLVKKCRCSRSIVQSLALPVKLGKAEPSPLAAAGWALAALAAQVGEIPRV